MEKITIEIEQLESKELLNKATNQVHTLLNFLTCCLLLKFTFEKVKPFRIIKIIMFLVFTIMQPSSDKRTLIIACDVMKNFN